MAQRKEEVYYDYDYDFDYDKTYDYQEQNYYYERDLEAFYAAAAQESEEVEQKQEELFINQEPKMPIYAAPRPFKSRFKDVSRLEKILAATIVFVTICFAVSTIFVRSKITGTMNVVNAVERENLTLTTNINDLRQQVTELSRRDRIETIAQQYGLTIGSDVRGATRNR
jgi:cell division protein FtsL